MSALMWYYCAVEECALAGRQFVITGKNISWYSFPVKDRQLMKEWRRALNYPDTWQPLVNQCVCERHFVFSDFVKDGSSAWRVLKPFVVPHIFNIELRKILRARRRQEKNMMSLDDLGEKLTSKYDLKDAIISLERIDKLLNIPPGKTSYIKLKSPYADDDTSWLKHYDKSKGVKRKPTSVKKVRRSMKKIREFFDENMDMSPEFMESLLTPETKLVEPEMTNVSIWAGKSDVSSPKSLFVVRDHLPAKLRDIAADHLWIQDPTCQGRRLKVQVVDATFNTTWVPDTPQNATVSGVYPVAINAVQRQPKYQETEESKSMTISDILRPSTSTDVDQSNSLLSSLLKKHVREPGIVQPAAFDACSYGINHDHQYFVPTDPLETLEPLALVPEAAAMTSEPKLLPATSEPSTSSTVPVTLPGFNLLPATNYVTVQKMFSTPVQPQAVYQPQSRSMVVSVLKPERSENIELREARNRIMTLENELTDTRRQLSAARLLINRLRLGELAKSAQIRALQQAEKAQNLPLYNQVFESSTFENFGQHFMAVQSRADYDSSFKM